ncbi:DgyrCDS8115 [Dimorphilus gyrociliatus]|uniref:DgyrCDS8115 n=1 Tax=Dimorphilus gyrociliatus TaxID=2664684 RepID=A0A7I8VT81_9ANNE|nr:DgyrCDS8115 [Dimorphilus gyrociliatus]
MSRYKGKAEKEVSLTNEVALLRGKVKEMESEITSYKRKLDELRRAKNTTVLRKEKEYVQCGIQRRNSSTSNSSLERGEDNQNKKLNNKCNHEEEISVLYRKISDLEIERENYLSKQNKETKFQCNHEEEIRKLKGIIKELNDDKFALQLENEDLTKKVSELFDELSVKEATWCENVKKIKAETQLNWQARYDEWMTKTQEKIQELQTANELLQGSLRLERGRLDNEDFHNK